MVAYRSLIPSIAVLILTLSLYQCTPVRIQNSGTGVLVGISASSSALAASGKGITITITNVRTGQSYVSRPLGPLSNHSVLQNVVPGQYLVTRLDLPVGSLTFTNQSEQLADYFGTLDFRSGEKYYLGNFRGRQRIGTRNILTLQLAESEVPEKLVEKVEDQSTGYSDAAFILISPPTESQLMVY
ncbi:MAG: hypothetical protein WA952_06345 [Lewinella sp.]